MQWATAVGLEKMYRDQRIEKRETNHRDPSNLQQNGGLSGQIKVK